MPQLKTEIILNASKEKVWDVLTSFDTYKNWNPFIIASTGKAIEGQSLENTMILNGKENTFKPVITKVIEHQEFEWLGSGFFGMFKGRHYFKLEEINSNQTKLIHGEYFSGLLSGIIMKMIGDDTLKHFQAMNKALKEEVEK